MSAIISPHDILRAYAMGLFPMADSADAAEIYWYDPPQRGQLSIDKLHIPRRLRRTVLDAPFTVRVDTAFAAVIDGCAASTAKRPKTWINPVIRDLFTTLHRAGFAHSVECWHGAALVGGVYGLALGTAFFGESMFSRATDASKVALVHLTARLWRGGFTLFDTQFTNPHLEQFGVYEIGRDDYRGRLHEALKARGDFHAAGSDESALITAYLAHNTQ